MRTNRPSCILRLAVFFAPFLLLHGCFKDVKTECNYTLMPYLQAESGGETVIADDVIAYAFYADSTHWTVSSYEDALAGIITSKQSSSTTAGFSLSTEERNDDGRLVLTLTSSPAIIVVVDRANRVYAWRMTEVVPNVSDLYVSVTFRPWQAASYYIENEWRMVNQFYTPPAEEPGKETGDGTTEGETPGDTTEDGEQADGGTSGDGDTAVPAQQN